MNHSHSFFKSRKVLITGGLGFIGSNLTLELVKQKADVTLVDNFLPDHGANWRNIREIRPSVRVNLCDVRDLHSMRELLADTEIIFHLAGQGSHVLSLKNPFPDIDLNITATAILLELVRELKLNPVIVYTGTRGQYGKAMKLPVAEDQPSSPRGIYELTNLTAEKMMQIYHWNHHLRTVPLRLTNIYGPRAQMHHPHFGVVNWFVRLALTGKPITVFGDGKIRRDFIYVEDCVQALLRAAQLQENFGEIINIGNDQPRCFLDVADILCELIPGTSYQFTAFTAERAAQEPGDFYSDITKARRILSWEPKVELREGLARTVKYYKDCLEDYIG